MISARSTIGRPSLAPGLWRMKPITATLSSTTVKRTRKRRLTFEWQHLDNDVAEALETLWKGPPHAPELDCLSTPQCGAGGDLSGKMAKRSLDFKFTEAFHALGKSGQAVFEEI